MNISKITKFGIASLFAGIACGVAGADTNGELQERLERAELRIAELNADTNSNWLNDTRAEEIRSLVHDVLADADTRASMIGNGSPVTVNVHGFVQTRWSYNDIKTDGVDTTHGFNVPRTRLEISGDLHDWGYKVSGQWNDGGNFTLMDAYADWGGFKAGQFKSPFMKEVLGSQTDTLATERSVISNQFGQGRSQGVQYGYETALGGVTVAYTDGFNTANGAGVQNGYALTGRLDFSPADWINMGVAVSHNNLVVSDYNTWTADATFSAGGFDFTGAYVATMDDVNGDNWGTVWTTSYQCTDKMQGFVQYEMGHLEGVETDLKIATFGVNYAFNDNVKWTTDMGWAFDSVDAGWNLGNSGWNATASEGETLIRSQLQVKF
jgi:phosphate-selective porin OprO and OprP|tara:strand:+ start:405 stop:1544 length:1140 start_codon:yes stop_codon:yes gene_type:complete